MALTHLRYFDEVVRAGSIRVAAGRLNVAPSAISRQIRNIEREVGLPLLERHTRGVALTSAGEIYARYARTTLLDHEGARAEIDDLKGLRRGHVRICSVEGIVADGLTMAMAAFRARFPGVTFRLTITGTENVAIAVRNGDADVGVAFTSNPEPRIRYAFRVRDPLLAVVAPKHPLTKADRVGFAEALAYPVAVPERDFGIRRLIDARCRSGRLVLNPAVETNSIEALRGFARSGCGVTFLPRLAIKRELDAASVAAVPLIDRDMQQTTFDGCVLDGRKLPAATRQFLDQLRRIFSDEHPR